MGFTRRVYIYQKDLSVLGKNCSVLWRKYTGIGLTAVVDWEARNVAVNPTHDIRLETVEARARSNLHFRAQRFLCGSQRGDGCISW